jgi:hypothetical protein
MLLQRVFAISLNANHHGDTKPIRSLQNMMDTTTKGEKSNETIRKNILYTSLLSNLEAKAT